MCSVDMHTSPLPLKMRCEAASASMSSGTAWGLVNGRSSGGSSVGMGVGGGGGDTGGVAYSCGNKGGRRRFPWRCLPLPRSPPTFPFLSKRTLPMAQVALLVSGPVLVPGSLPHHRSQHVASVGVGVPPCGRLHMYPTTG